MSNRWISCYSWTAFNSYTNGQISIASAGDRLWLRTETVRSFKVTIVVLPVMALFYLRYKSAQNYSLVSRLTLRLYIIYVSVLKKNYVMQIMTRCPSRHLVLLQGKLERTGKQTVYILFTIYFNILIYWSSPDVGSWLGRNVHHIKLWKILSFIIFIFISLYDGAVQDPALSLECANVLLRNFFYQSNRRKVVTDIRTAAVPLTPNFL